ncbi:hypothetical protein BDK51DRAFT_40839 [Blyttiomyces helicus]|uniref:Uncharacterized protein n=1 Tax=Blyttiomyces helicus TaxID=388810 RepID=A0A4P9W2G4_9FUNG|nr:hypothetical protein BDK51DRAFT_40839 [Blyttiomyces helicus]|eukprot:RKO86411.1 hypothetical protein BDK51DRAFT_40839 [Blyttiomyces helicus]
MLFVDFPFSADLAGGEESADVARKLGSDPFQQFDLVLQHSSSPYPTVTAGLALDHSGKRGEVDEASHAVGLEGLSSSPSLRSSWKLQELLKLALSSANTNPRPNSSPPPNRMLTTGECGQGIDESTILSSPGSPPGRPSLLRLVFCQERLLPLCRVTSEPGGYEAVVVLEGCGAQRKSYQCCTPTAPPSYDQRGHIDHAPSLVCMLTHSTGSYASIQCKAPLSPSSSKQRRCMPLTGLAHDSRWGTPDSPSRQEIPRASEAQASLQMSAWGRSALLLVCIVEVPPPRPSRSCGALDPSVPPPRVLTMGPAASGHPRSHSKERPNLVIRPGGGKATPERGSRLSFSNISMPVSPGSEDAKDVVFPLGGDKGACLFTRPDSSAQVPHVDLNCCHFATIVAQSPRCDASCTTTMGDDDEAPHPWLLRAAPQSGQLESDSSANSCSTAYDELLVVFQPTAQTQCSTFSPPSLQVLLLSFSCSREPSHPSSLSALFQTDHTGCCEHCSFAGHHPANLFPPPSGSSSFPHRTPECCVSLCLDGVSPDSLTLNCSSASATLCSRFLTGDKPPRRPPNANMLVNAVNVLIALGQSAKDNAAKVVGVKDDLTHPLPLPYANSRHSLAGLVATALCPSPYLPLAKKTAVSVLG